MSDATIEDIYRRLNALTEDVNNLKIQAGTIGSTQVAVAQTLSLVTALTSEVQEQKTDIRQLKTDMREVKADLHQVTNDVTEILRILRDRNGGSGF